jgi:hypothetical protein
MKTNAELIIDSTESTTSSSLDLTSIWISKELIDKFWLYWFESEDNSYISIFSRDNKKFTTNKDWEIVQARLLYYTVNSKLFTVKYLDPTFNKVATLKTLDFVEAFKLS